MLLIDPDLDLRRVRVGDMYFDVDLDLDSPREFRSGFRSTMCWRSFWEVSAGTSDLNLIYIYLLLDLFWIHGVSAHMPSQHCGTNALRTKI